MSVFATDDGFSILSDERMEMMTGQRKADHKGNCMEDNGKRILQFWEKGFKDCVYVAGVIEVKGRKMIQNPRPAIHHFFVWDKKNDRIISTSNGKHSIHTRESYITANPWICYAEMTWDDLQKLKKMNPTATDLECVMGWGSKFGKAMVEPAIKWCKKNGFDYNYLKSK